MPDVFTVEKRSAVMAAIKSRGNRDTELRLITLFRAAGVKGWRRGSQLFGRPDFVFRREKVVVFVDGDFWHGHPTRSRIPVGNAEFWAAKIAANRRRDRLVNRTLRAQGWVVLRIWEFSLTRRYANATLTRIVRTLRRSGEHDRFPVIAGGRSSSSGSDIDGNQRLLTSVAPRVNFTRL